MRYKWDNNLKLEDLRVMMVQYYRDHPGNYPAFVQGGLVMLTCLAFRSDEALFR